MLLTGITFWDYIYYYLSEAEWRVKSPITDSHPNVNNTSKHVNMTHVAPWELAWEETNSKHFDRIFNIIYILPDTVLHCFKQCWDISHRVLLIIFTYLLQYIILSVPSKSNLFPSPVAVKANISTFQWQIKMRFPFPLLLWVWDLSGCGALRHCWWRM